MQVHEQLERLWQFEPIKDRSDLRDGSHNIFKHEKNFVVLAGYDGKAACEIKVVFYEPEGSLEVASQVADADNRLAGLLDLLAIPVDPQAAALLPNPTFVLLENDRLVWSIEVQRKRLLRKIENRDVFTRLVVRIIPTAPTLDNIALIDIPAH
ncbi:hypothetical protein XM25_05235 [Devosia sp. H5989]|nr:hypothetical protein XM25_05235 [Devosia sp. H5989]